jgi:hypothetical protein
MPKTIRASMEEKAFNLKKFPMSEMADFDSYRVLLSKRGPASH